MSTRDSAIARIAARQHGVFSRDQARATGFDAGATYRRKQSGRWIEIEPGVYLVHGAPVTWHTRVLAACLTTRGVATHRTEAALRGLSGFRRGRPEVTVHHDVRVRSTTIRMHRSLDLRPEHVTTIDGIPVTVPSRLVVDLGSVISFSRYELAVDELIAQRALTWDDALDSLLWHARRGRNGVGALRALLTNRYGDDVSESALERAFERLFRLHDLPRPVPQFEIFDATGFVARVDFAYPGHRIAIELDSRKHHMNAAAFEADPRKRNRLAVDGWLVLAFTWEMVLDHPGAIVRQIRRALDSRSIQSPRRAS